jgi:hypothetical protein
MDPPRTLVTFRSDRFETRLPGEHFVNPGCFGDDVARWLIRELRARGIETADEPEPEDFGWYFGFRAGDVDCELVIGWRPGGDGEPGTWIGWIERSANLLLSVLGGRRRGIPPEAMAAVHAVLAGSGRVSDVRWHARDELDAGREAGAPTPAGG